MVAEWVLAFEGVEPVLGQALCVELLHQKVSLLLLLVSVYFSLFNLANHNFCVEMGRHSYWAIAGQREVSEQSLLLLSQDDQVFPSLSIKVV